MTNVAQRPVRAPDTGRHRRPNADQASPAVVAVLAATWCWLISWRDARPAEDAAILFRYVDNVAAGHGIVWNVRETPVDGATDLGFMLVLAVLRTTGVNAQTAALAVNSLAFIAVAVGLYVFARRRIGGVLATLVTGLFIVSPGPALIHVGFGAVAFSACIALAGLAVFRLTDRPSLSSALQLASAGVVAGLVRPEGFLIAGVLILTAIAIGPRHVIRAAVLAGLLLVAAGVVFVAVRWTYFGHPLPNPYYRKGGGTLHTDGLLQSLKFAVTVGAIPLALLAAVGLGAHRARRWITYSGCIAVLLGMWVLLSSEMNYSFRFQFPILILALFMTVDLGSRSVPSLSERLASTPRVLRRWAPVVIVVAVVMQLVAGQFVLSRQSTDTSHEAIADILAEVRDDRLVVATTEAGYICWKSGWTCIDLWGLNDKRIAHDGFLDEASLGELHPDVIVAHVPTTPSASSIHDADFFLEGWEHMTDPVIRFAERSGYVLAAILRPRSDSGIAVYVRPSQSFTSRLAARFGAIEPTIQQFYGLSGDADPALPTNG
jgi:hypothetical protein